MRTAVASDEPEPPATGGVYRFAELHNDCVWPTTPPVRSAALLAASQAWLSTTRTDIIPLSTIKLEGRAA